MALQSIGLGTTEGDGTGDSIRAGGDKINDNFSELYTLLGTGTTLTSGISATATVVTLAEPSITGVASFADGSASAPSITNTGDANTGIFFSAADTVSVTTGGTLRTSVDSNGLSVTGSGTFSGAVQPNASDAAGLGTASLQWSDLFLADSAAMFFGDNNEVALTHIHDTGLLLNAAMVLQFRDAAINIGSPADGDFDINADDEIELNSTLIDINGAVDISGATHIDGVLTQGVEGDLHGGGVIMDASASGTDVGDEILLDGTDGSSSNENEKLILEYATQFTTAVLQIKNSDGIVISSLFGTGGF